MIDKSTRFNWLKIVVILLLVILFIQIILSRGLDSCDKCRFKYNLKTLHTSQMLGEYEKQCFSEQDIDLKIIKNDIKYKVEVLKNKTLSITFNDKSGYPNTKYYEAIFKTKFKDFDICNIKSLDEEGKMYCDTSNLSINVEPIETGKLIGTLYIIDQYGNKEVIGTDNLKDIRK